MTIVLISIGPCTIAVTLGLVTHVLTLVYGSIGTNCFAVAIRLTGHEGALVCGFAIRTDAAPLSTSRQFAMRSDFTSPLLRLCQLCAKFNSSCRRSQWRS